MRFIYIIELFLFLVEELSKVSHNTCNESHHKNNKFAVGGSNEDKTIQTLLQILLQHTIMKRKK